MALEINYGAKARRLLALLVIVAVASISAPSTVLYDAMKEIITTAQKGRGNEMTNVMTCK